jgi:membrane protein
MVENIYLFLIDYVNTILFHPILKGIELSILILLWQLIGGIVLFGLTYLLKPIDKMFNVNTRYLVLSFGLLVGLFLPIFIATNDWNDDKSVITVFQRVFRSVAKLEMAFVTLTLVTLILGVGIIVPIYSITMAIFNFVIGIIPVLAGFAVLIPILFVGGILSLVGAVANRF